MHPVLVSLKTAYHVLISPDSDIAHNTHWNIHLLYLTLEDQESAQKALESYIDKYPNEEMRVMEAFDKLSVFAVKQNDWGMALYYADKILEVNPDRFTLVLTKAMALLHLGQKESGKKLLERILNEDEGSVQYNLAMMEMDNLRTGKYNKSSEKDAKEQTGEHAEKASRNITDLEKPQLSEKSTPTPADKQQVSASDPLQIGQYKLTIERMKQLIQGVQMFYLEEMRLPKTLGELLEAGFVKPEFMRDVWGREFHIRTDPANENCWIASGGSDDRFLGFEQKGTYSHLSGQDIIACNLRFVFAPDFE